MIEVENLIRYYGNLAAIRDVSFTVQEGEILGFLGPNAAGKTTTMRILTGFMPPSSGTARVAGFDVFEDSLQVRKRIGYMPETVPLYPEMTVSFYLNFVARIRNVEDRKEQIENVMDTCDISHYADAHRDIDAYGHHPYPCGASGRHGDHRTHNHCGANLDSGELAVPTLLPGSAEAVAGCRVRQQAEGLSGSPGE